MWHRVMRRVVAGVVAMLCIDVARSFATEPLPAVVEHVRAMPVVWNHRYRIGAAIRFLPLPFMWITKENAGTGRITRRRSPDGEEGFEMLMGSEPERVPRRINRWGYIAERVRGADAAIFAVMNQSSTKTMGETTARIARERSEKRYLYSFYEATVHGGVARGAVARVWLPEDFTYREVDTVLTRTRDGGSAARTSSLALPSGARPGFVAALTDLIHRDVVRLQGTKRASERLVTYYVHDGSLFELTLRASRVVDAAAIGGRAYTNLVRGEFVGRKTTGQKRSNFEVLYGSQGELAEVPIRLTFEARWWFRIEMTLLLE